MIECKTYTLTEFHKALGFSMRSWRDRKEEFLEHLHDYFDYDLMKVGKAWSFIIKEQFAEYEPLPRKNVASKKQKESFYQEQTEKIIAKDAYNTATNIVRNIVHEHDKGPFNHAFGTMRNYVSPIVKNDYVHPMQEAQWMRKSDDELSYVPLTSEELNDLRELFQLNSDLTEMQLKIIGDLKSNYITKEEATAQLLENAKGTYTDIMTSFREKHGFWPMRIRKLEKNAFRPEN